MLILDYSQVAMANIFSFQNDLKKTSADRESAINIIRHAILTGIKFYKKKYGPEYGELIIACDGREYWRKDVFPYYKGDRARARAKSDLDWKLIFDTINQIRSELIESFPYKVIHVNRAEADDIIATLCKWTQLNGMIDRGLFEERQPVMIVSSDGDFKQLHKYPNVRQWSPIQKKFVTCSNPREYLAEHIAKAGDDGIPNVLSADNVIVDQIRQSKMTSKKLALFVENGRDACEDETQRRNWDRNNMLINFDCIPVDVELDILHTYLNTQPTGKKIDVFNYLVKHKCRLLLDELEEFF